MAGMSLGGCLVVVCVVVGGWGSGWWGGSTISPDKLNAPGQRDQNTAVLMVLRCLDASIAGVQRVRDEIRRMLFEIDIRRAQERTTQKGVRRTACVMFPADREVRRKEFLANISRWRKASGLAGWVFWKGAFRSG